MVFCESRYNFTSLLTKSSTLSDKYDYSLVRSPRTLITHVLYTYVVRTFPCRVR